MKEDAAKVCAFLESFSWVSVSHETILTPTLSYNNQLLPDEKVIGYTNIPLLILSIYNAHLSKAANELIEPLPRIIFAAVLAVLVAATLL